MGAVFYTPIRAYCLLFPGLFMYAVAGLDLYEWGVVFYPVIAMRRNLSFILSHSHACFPFSMDRSAACRDIVGRAGVNEERRGWTFGVGKTC